MGLFITSYETAVLMLHKSLWPFVGVYVCGFCQPGLIAKGLTGVNGLISECHILLYIVEIVLQAMMCGRTK